MIIGVTTHATAIILFFPQPQRPLPLLWSKIFEYLICFAFFYFYFFFIFAYTEFSFFFFYFNYLSLKHCLDRVVLSLSQKGFEPGLQ